jgi:mRNA-degrading endonuclease RelE of RelBE toxin-antitoxin system
MNQASSVPRPQKSTEYVIRYGSHEAEKGWRDLLATQRNAVVDAWDRLTTHPLDEDTRCHQLKGELTFITRNGMRYGQRQYELTGGARIWFYVDPGTRSVVLVRVSTAHPNQTK